MINPDGEDNGVTNDNSLLYMLHANAIWFNKNNTHDERKLENALKLYKEITREYGNVATENTVKLHHFVFSSTNGIKDTIELNELKSDILYMCKNNKHSKDCYADSCICTVGNSSDIAIVLLIMPYASNDGYKRYLRQFFVEDSDNWFSIPIPPIFGEFKAICNRAMQIAGMTGSQKIVTLQEHFIPADMSQNAIGFPQMIRKYLEKHQLTMVVPFDNLRSIEMKSECINDKKYVFSTNFGIPSVTFMEQPSENKDDE